MPITVTCNDCSTTLRVSDDVAGKRFKCNRCEAVLEAPELHASPKVQEPGQPRKRRAQKQAQRRRPEPKPRRKRRRRKKRRARQEPSFAGVSSYRYQSVPRPDGYKKKRRESEGPSRESHPEAFEEFDAVIKELSTFYIGLAVIVACLGGAIFGIAGPPNYPQRMQNILVGHLILAGVLFMMGILMLTREPIILHILRVASILFAAAAGGLIVLSGGDLLIFLGPVCGGFVMAVSRISRALDCYPR